MTADCDVRCDGSSNRGRRIGRVRFRCHLSNARSTPSLRLSPASHRSRGGIPDTADRSRRNANSQQWPCARTTTLAQPLDPYWVPRSVPVCGSWHRVPYTSLSRPAFSLASFHPPTARMIVADAGRNPRSSYSAFVGDSPNRSAASRNASRHSVSVVRVATDTGGNPFSARPGLELTFEIRKRVSYGLLYVVSGSTVRSRAAVLGNSYTTPYQAPTAATSETYPTSPCSTAASRSSIPARTRRPRSPSAPSSPS